MKGSGKSQHVHEVLEWARMNKPTGPIGVLATGTPLSNAIGELHTLVRMANPELLRDIDAELFDSWASMYGSMVERMEMTTDGKGFKSVQRFASFHNVPAMVRQLWHPLVDYKSAEDLGLELPDIKGGEPELMLVPATADQLQRMQELGERYEAFREGGVDKSVDNPLAINNDARVIAMDSRLIDADAEPSNKLTALADRIIAKHEETKDNRYTYSAGDKRPHPVPGALQFVFLNNGTPWRQEPRRVQRLPGAEGPPRRPRHACREDRLHPRRRTRRPAHQAPARREPRRHQRPGRLHHAHGQGPERTEPRGLAVPRRPRLASLRHGPARRPHRPQRQPESRGGSRLDGDRGHL
ncbi:hypothetical protein GCM10020254_87750 [Streptomyces goshikiensis]